jgi:hypothetical protein
MKVVRFGMHMPAKLPVFLLVDILILFYYHFGNGNRKTE